MCTPEAYRFSPEYQVTQTLLKLAARELVNNYYVMKMEHECEK